MKTDTHPMRQTMKQLFLTWLLIIPTALLAKPTMSITVPIYGYEDYPTLNGTITLTEQDDQAGLTVKANINGLSPGKHGFHIHEHANCNTQGGKNAGGHFNPHHVTHGSPTSSTQHLGDLGNLMADHTGHAYLTAHNKQLSFSEQHAIGGRSFIIHQAPDDFVSQPTGNAGGRIACATIPILMHMSPQLPDKQTSPQ